MMIPFKKINFADDKIQRFQDNVGNVLDSLSSSFLLNAVLQTGSNVQGLTFVSGADTYVNHGLNRVPQGYFIVGKNTPVDIYTSTTPSPDPNALIVLVSNANAIVNIVFF
jgi:hypothetical protein